MKKTLMMGFALVAALAFVSCKSSESEYKKAYEKAKAQEMARANTTDQVETAPVTVTPVVTTTTPTTPTVENTANDRQERLTVMNGGTLKAFNVVCGSFSNVDNANNLRNTLVAKGYSAQVAQNPETGMYNDEDEEMKYDNNDKENNFDEKKLEKKRIEKMGMIQNKDEKTVKRFAKLVESDNESDDDENEGNKSNLSFDIKDFEEAYEFAMDVENSSNL